MSGRTVTLKHDTETYTATIGADGRVRVGNQEVAVVPAADGTLRVGEPPGTVAWAVSSHDRRWVFLDGRAYDFEVPRQQAARRRTGTHHESLNAPMPATVRRINVGVGDRVSRGDILIVLEAMKMELPVKAASAATVEAINCREGDLVQPGAALIELEEDGT